MVTSPSVVVGSVSLNSLLVVMSNVTIKGDLQATMGTLNLTTTALVLIEGPP